MTGRFLTNGRHTDAGDAARDRARRGFSMPELIMVMVVLGVLAGIALLKLADLRDSARAAEVAHDFRTVLIGAYGHYAEKEDWPADAGPGVVPPALVPFLPASFSFSRAHYTLDYENFGLGGGGAYMVGVTVTSANANLMNRLIRNLGASAVYFVAGNSLTYIIVGADGKS